jgi:hypothetical protein
LVNSPDLKNPSASWKVHWVWEERVISKEVASPMFIRRFLAVRITTDKVKLNLSTSVESITANNPRR